MSKSSRVEFRAADGVVLRGDFYRAEGKVSPIVVMTAGLHLLKEHYLPAFAERYRAAGISSLAFDYRTYGSSEGTPRQDSDLFQQAEDYRDAVTAAMDLPGVDPAKVVVMGPGHGGAAALLAIADDPRPAAALLQSPIASGRKDAEAFPPGWLDRAWRDREAKTRAGDATPSYVQVWPDAADKAGPGEPILFRNPLAHGFITQALRASEAAGTPWENRMTLRSLLSIARTEPRDFIHKIEQPTLYVVFPSDPFTGTAEFHRAAFDRMGPNGEFKVVVPPTDGSVEDFIVSTAKAQIEFLGRVL